ncbi:Uncharacterized protein M6B38_215375 [Iris pallida]|uniref:Uncharacterized protein n=1 Tax=Iris pallida TaxID=29817 RepID=A0AAX6E225_IRIPA|nr:Uncharacterized protein M6B38_215375 [Iris pallida]
MPQPYTRSQLSEKLRRLRKKYRTVSARVARGLDPSRLAPTTATSSTSAPASGTPTTPPPPLSPRPPPTPPAPP